MMFCIGYEFLEKNWILKHITISLFEAFEH